MRRLKLLAITPQVLLDLFFPGHAEYRFGGLPEDAVAKGVQYDIERDQILIVVESASFPDVLEGALLEPITVTVTRVEATT